MRRNYRQSDHEMEECVHTVLSVGNDVPANEEKAWSAGYRKGGVSDPRSIRRVILLKGAPEMHQDLFVAAAADRVRPPRYMLVTG